MNAKRCEELKRLPQAGVISDDSPKVRTLEKLDTFLLEVHESQVIMLTELEVVSSDFLGSRLTFESEVTLDRNRVTALEL